LRVAIPNPIFKSLPGKDALNIYQICQWEHWTDLIGPVAAGQPIY